MALVVEVIASHCKPSSKLHTVLGSRSRAQNDGGCRGTKGCVRSCVLQSGLLGVSGALFRIEIGKFSRYALVIAYRPVVLRCHVRIFSHCKGHL